MSIINDALKKAQAKLKKKIQTSPPEISPINPPASPTPTAPPTPAAPATSVTSAIPTGSIMKRKKAWYNTISGLIGLFLFITGCLIAALLNLISHSKAKQQQAVQRTTAVQNTARIMRPLIKRAYQRASPSGLLLNGTMMTGDKRIALINDEVYEEGDMINGMEIVDISLKEVQLKSGSKIITVKVHKKP